MSADGWPHAAHPAGWYQVAWSAELSAGAVLPRRYFDAELVLFREESGPVRMLDAHCAHLGAHLGHGGKVDGDTIVCPFHGWRWSGEGRNTCIPYSDRPYRGSLRSWDIREQDEVILAWYDANGGPPGWEPPQLSELVGAFALGDCYPVHLTSRSWEDKRVRPQWVVENFVDVAHFQFVHSARAVTQITEHHTEGEQFHVSHRFEGRRGSGLKIVSAGLGLGYGIFSNNSGISHVELQATTPVAGDRSDLRESVWLRRDPASPYEPTVKQRAMLDRQLAELGSDLQVWEHMVYRERAPLTAEEVKPYKALREWAEQFYPEVDGG